MNNREYWLKRAKQIESQNHELTLERIETISKEFNKSKREINKQIDSWLIRIMDNNEVSLQEAKRYLKSDELEDFRMTLDEYIELGEKKGFDKAVMKRLENASARVHITRLEQIRTQLDAELTKLYDEYEKQTGEVLDETFRRTYVLTGESILTRLDIKDSFDRIDTNKIETFINTKWASDGKMFSDRIWDNKEKLLNTIETELTQMIIRGCGRDEIARNISKKMDTSFKNAARLVQTECAAITSAAQKEMYNTLDVEEYEIVAVLDIRTSEFCQSMDGVHIPIKMFSVGKTAPPFHVNCRSTTCPYFDDDVGERSARDANGKSYYTNDMQYKVWYDKFIK